MVTDERVLVAGGKAEVVVRRHPKRNARAAHTASRGGVGGGGVGGAVTGGWTTTRRHGDARASVVVAPPSRPVPPRPATSDAGLGAAPLPAPRTLGVPI